MKNVYIIDDYFGSKTNGIGTYINELIFCLKETETNICQIACSHESISFRILMSNGIPNSKIPIFINRSAINDLQALS